MSADPGIDVLLDVYISGNCAGLVIFLLLRLADGYIQYRSTGEFFGTSRSKISGGIQIFTWRSNLAYFFIGITPIILTSLFKAIENASAEDTVLNELRGVVFTASLSVLSIILLCADVLRLAFPHRRKRYLVVEAFTMTITLAFQIVNTVLLQFDSAAGVNRFDETFFPIHCVELFGTLLLTQGFLLYGIYSNVLNNRNAKKLHMRNIYVTLSIALITQFWHIALIVYNVQQGVTLNTAVPRIVMMFTSFNVLVILLHSLMRLVNRINDILSSANRGSVLTNRSSAVDKAASKSSMPRSVQNAAGHSSTPMPSSTVNANGTVTAAVTVTGRPSIKQAVPGSPRSQLHHSNSPRDSSSTPLPPSDFVSIAELQVQTHRDEESQSASAAASGFEIQNQLQRASNTAPSRFGRAANII